jgi:hypothetical protein
MNSFTRTTSGRLMALSFASALLGGGISALTTAPVSLYVMSISTFAGVVGCVAALQLAEDEHFEQTIMSVILLPFALFLYAVALGFVMNHWAVAAYALLALGIVPLVTLVRSITVEKSAAPAAMSAAPAHATEH